MGGASIARTVEGAAAVFGNPANLTQYKEGTTFIFGATSLDPQIKITAPFKGTSNADNYLIPTVSVTQGLGGIGFENLVLGMGLTATGAGSDFRAVPGSIS